MGARDAGDGGRSAKVFRRHDTGREVITRSSTQDGVGGGTGVSKYVRVDAGSAPDSEIASAYRELRSAYKGDRYRRTMLRIYRKDIRRAMRADRRRSKMRILRKGKWLSVASLLVSLYLGFSEGVFSIPAVSSTEEFYGDLPQVIADNARAFMDGVQWSELMVGLFALGIVIYIAGVAGVWVSDRGLKRRLLVHAMSESMTENDSRTFRNAFTKDRVRKLMYGKTSVLSIREASRADTLNGFVRSQDKGPKYRRSPSAPDRCHPGDVAYIC